jgi:hypothetical protein
MAALTQSHSNLSNLSNLYPKKGVLFAPALRDAFDTGFQEKGWKGWQVGRLADGTPRHALEHVDGKPGETDCRLRR